MQVIRVLGGLLMVVRVRVEPALHGPASVGTIRLIEMIREHCGLGLTEAKGLVDRMVWDGETVSLSMPSHEAAVRLEADLAGITAPPRVFSVIAEQ